MERSERENVVRRQVRKLANRVRRERISECVVRLDPDDPPLRGFPSLWIGRIEPTPGHTILISADVLHGRSPTGTSTVPLDRVVSYGWAAARTRDKLRDGHRLAVELDDGSEVIVDAPGWAWQEVFHLFRLLLEPERS